MKTIDVLIRARARIADPKNWIKGNFREAGGYCALGALGFNDAQKQPMQAEKAADWLFTFLPSWVEDQGYSIPDWNDSSETTHADVLAAFDKAIEALS